MRYGKVLTWILSVFIVFDMAISGLSLIRAYRRYQQIPAQSVIGEYLDEHYPDEYLAHRYQNMSQK